jgi:NADPH:quinone reductase-like Zn-dependent oxidoreductase
MYAVQLAKLIGYKVAATCSPHSFDLVKGLGADLVVDYHNPTEAVRQIKEASNGKVVGSLECIGGKENTQLAIDTFGEAGGKLTVLLGVPEGLERADKIKANSILLYVVGGYVRLSTQVSGQNADIQAFEFIGKQVVPADPKAEQWFKNFVPQIPKYVSEYNIKPNPTSVRDGMDSILPGLKDLEVSHTRFHVVSCTDEQEGKVSGTKIVFHLA